MGYRNTNEKGFSCPYTIAGGWVLGHPGTPFPLLTPFFFPPFKIFRSPNLRIFEDNLLNHQILYEFPIGSQKYRKMLKLSCFHDFYGQIWLNPLMEDCHFCYNTNWEKQNTTLAFLLCMLIWNL
jgi:hypothetical protein